MRLLVLILCLFASPACLGGDRPLEVYFVDVEGGQATLIVSSSGESLLIDTGWPGFGGRDADRIVAAARSAGLKKIDYVLITHFHTDHVGGAAQLAERMPVGAFFDHGPSVEKGQNADDLAAIYKTARANSRHMVLQPGDKVPIKGIDITVLTAAGNMIATPSAGAAPANSFCADSKPQDEDLSENAQSIGIFIQHGKFRMIDLGDLTWNEELELACPSNRASEVDVYLTTHHGGPSSGAPAIVHALRPRVAIMNNGARKGGDPKSLQTIRTAPGLLDVWQIHYAMNAAAEDNSQQNFIANPEEKCEGHALQLAAGRDGAFTITNARNGFSKRYNPL